MSTTISPELAAQPLWRPRAGTVTQRRARVALFALLALTAIAYLWNLGASGDANSFYAAAVQAGTHSWKAFFFGSLDSSSFITTDKPPASIWVMALSGRIFGFSSWSMLVPQALEGVAAVGLLYAAVRRWFGSLAGLGAGLVLALTPVAALMFRFNNPDALLVLLLVASAYCLTRAIESAGTRWIVATGTLLGFAFLTKMGQALIVVPAFGGAYLLAAPTTFRRRLRDCVAGLAAMIVSGGWWVAIVALLPASSRPFIDGSPDNNILNLIFGYNGLQRLFGSGGPGSGGGGGGGASFSGPSGTLRLFNDVMGGQASWLMPAALIALLAGLWATRSAPRTDRTRAALIVWGGWLLVTAAVFSYSQGIIHTYYTVALAPAIGALVAIGAHIAWRRRESAAARLCAALTVGVTGAWSYALLDRTSSWQPWIRVLVVVATVVAVMAIVASLLKGAHLRHTAIVGTLAALVAGLAGPTAYAIATVSATHSGSTPSAGPAAAAGTLGGFGGFGGRGGLSPGGARSGGVSLFGGESGTPPTGSATGGPPAAGSFGAPSSGARGAARGAFGGAPSSGARGALGGGPGGGTASVSSALVRALESNASAYRWVAAADGSMSAASYELASGGEPVMAIGGFNGNGGNLSLAAFIRYVRAGEIHYFIGGGSGGGGGGFAGASGSSSSIASWVASHYSAQTIGGVTVYDLTSR
ncbi:MAG TPA: glycosyltransferase family 39 protein [Solirubrobacteraceae bacterium]|jgi:4-amino-4-deoxy-L-arabinose transferase-like glycosyltransferase|nr:glycosyltransferase family 39 protein [Solirubrobacteraceae bacterium]